MTLNKFLEEIKSEEYVGIFICIFLFLVYFIYQKMSSCKKSIENMTDLDDKQILNAINKYYVSDDFAKNIRTIAQRLQTSGLENSGFQIVGNIDVTGNIKADGEISNQNISFLDFNLKIDKKIKQLKDKAEADAKAAAEKAAAEKAAAEAEYLKDFLYPFKSQRFVSLNGVRSNINEGLDLESTRNAYRNANNTTWATNFLNMKIKGIQEWTVPVNGTYKITAIGASGGNSMNASGGLGAEVSITYNLKKSDILKIIVGVGGQNNNNDGIYGSGGGGGSFVILGNQPIIVAGGGGGAGNATSTNGGNGENASFTTSGTNGRNGSGQYFRKNGIGGTNGNGGTPGDSDNPGGPGGGFKTNGTDPSQWFKGKAGMGGPGNFIGGLGVVTNVGLGGFGGGGGAAKGGGGGGGYSGGAGGVWGDGGFGRFAKPEDEGKGGGGGGSYSITGKFDSQKHIFGASVEITLIKKL
jgi:hypothetical protein